MKIVFCTHASDDWYVPVGTPKLINSAKYFHPDIPFIVFKSKEINETWAKDPSLNYLNLHPVISAPLIEEYDLVVHFDADTIITGPLNEILVGDFDVAGVRNQNDAGTTAAGICFGHNVPKTVLDIDVATQYLNAGLVAVRHKEFYKDWSDLNNTEHFHYGMFEQDTLNILFHGRKYRTKILDDISTNVHYGVSGDSIVGPRKESWRPLTMKNGELMLHNKKVKVIHHAEGCPPPKLQYHGYVNPEVQKFLDRITGGA